MTKEIKKDQKENVGYKGQVEIGIIKNGKKYKKVIKNAGTVDLFTYLCACLTGTVNPNYDVNKRPGKLRLYASSGSTVLSYGLPFENITVESSAPGVAEKDAYGNVIYNFLVPGTAIFKKPVKTVGLFSIDDAVQYATAEFPAEIVVNDVDTNIYVSWTLTIKNI